MKEAFLISFKQQKWFCNFYEGRWVIYNREAHNHIYLPQKSSA